ncbi:MAG: metal-sensing transcriptional repressor [Synechococcaceae cyanobacterium RM1_1_27]|nr:metal-sensing transcriptional repressor [Synechococcaceae cyanobacterium SM2_3_2]NJO86187.1 metal-sensing transcriptional repressor [Synechococcaceae cyanobacterium RM1_1_27]
MPDLVPDSAGSLPQSHLNPVDRHNHAHPHVHDPESERKLINRLSRIEGHVRGIRTMISDHQPCPDVLLQIAAVRGALDRVARLILEEHVSECITRAVDSQDREVIQHELEDLRHALDRFIR